MNTIHPYESQYLLWQSVQWKFSFMFCGESWPSRDRPTLKWTSSKHLKFLSGPVVGWSRFLLTGVGLWWLPKCKKDYHMLHYQYGTKRSIRNGEQRGSLLNMAKSVDYNSEILTTSCCTIIDISAQNSTFMRSWRCPPLSSCLGECFPAKPEQVPLITSFAMQILLHIIILSLELEIETGDMMSSQYCSKTHLLTVASIRIVLLAAAAKVVEASTGAAGVVPHVTGLTKSAVCNAAAWSWTVTSRWGAKGAAASHIAVLSMSAVGDTASLVAAAGAEGAAGAVAARTKLPWRAWVTSPNWRAPAAFADHLQ